MSHVGWGLGIDWWKLVGLGCKWWPFGEGGVWIRENEWVEPTYK